MHVRRRRLFVMSVVACATTLGLACSFPDVTFGTLVASAPGDADTADHFDGGSVPNEPDADADAGATDVDPDGADAAVAVLDDAALTPVDASGCTSCDCDNDDFDRLDLDAGCDGGGKQKGVDCDDSIRAIRPLQDYVESTTWPSTDPKLTPFDWDCDGQVTRRYTYDLEGRCGLLCNKTGFLDNPNCGETRDLVVCRGLALCSAQSAGTEIQGCR